MLVFGGSLGARSINEAAVTPSATRRSGSCTPAARATTRRCASGWARPSEAYDLRDYISPFGQALAAADLTVARSGGSIAEIAAHGLPAILVPYPYAAADHRPPTRAGWSTRRRRGHPRRAS